MERTAAEVLGTRGTLTVHEQQELSVISDGKAVLSDREMDEVRAKWCCMDSFGQRYRECSLSNYDATTDSQRAAVEVLRQHVLDFPDRNVLIYGPCGTGKDHLIAGLARSLMQSEWKPSPRGYSLHRHPIGVFDGMSLFDTLRDRISDRDQVDLTKDSARYPIVYISDPTPLSGALSQFEQRHLYRILDARYRELKPTWMTCNVSSRDQLDECIGVRNSERILDGATSIYCDWPSYRKTNG